jgi:hypothetical protein
MVRRRRVKRMRIKLPPRTVRMKVKRRRREELAVRRRMMMKRTEVKQLRPPRLLCRKIVVIPQQSLSRSVIQAR